MSAQPSLALYVMFFVIVIIGLIRGRKDADKPRRRVRT